VATDEAEATDDKDVLVVFGSNGQALGNIVELDGVLADGSLDVGVFVERRGRDGGQRGRRGGRRGTR